MKTKILGYEFTNADDVRCILKTACTDLLDAEWDSFIAQVESTFKHWLQSPESQKNNSKYDFNFSIRHRNIGILVIPDCNNRVKLQLSNEEGSILYCGSNNANIFYTGKQGDKK